MSLCLTRAELVELSERERPSAIRRWLDKRSIPYILDADGWPKVLRSAIDREPQKPQDTEPRLRPA